MHNRSGFGVLAVSGVVAFGAIAVAFFAGTFETKNEARAPEAPITVVAEARRASANVNAENAGRDTDGDGLLNWEETLYGTDPNKSDTDGDGMSDADEAAQGADPLVFGTDVKKDGVYIAPSALSSTEAVARELFAGYAGARQGGALDRNQIENSIEDIVGRRLGDASRAPQFTLADIKTENDVTVDAYAGSVSRALKEADTVREYELSVFARAVEKNRDIELEKLKATVSVYTSIQRALLALEVPPDIVNEHLAFVNSVASLAHEVERLSTWSGDPFDALVLVGDYSDAENEMVARLNDLFTFMQTLQST